LYHKDTVEDEGEEEEEDEEEKEEEEEDRQKKINARKPPAAWNIPSALVKNCPATRKMPTFYGT
jgi:hypothetical protein